MLCVSPNLKVQTRIWKIRKIVRLRPGQVGRMFTKIDKYVDDNGKTNT